MPTRRPKPQKRAVMLWDRMYTILRYNTPPDETAGPMEPRVLGMLDEGTRKIHIRACTDQREEIRTVLHELIHHALGADFDRLSERQMDVLDGHLVANLAALGVDLSPLTKGYK